MLESLGDREKLLVGAASFIVVIGLIWMGLRITAGALEGGYEIRAVFSHVGQGLDHFSDVRIRGVRVGTVSHLELNDEGRAVVTMHIDDGVRVPDTASAAIEPLSIFGPKFVELIPGDNEASGPYLEPNEDAPPIILDTNAPTSLEDMFDRAEGVLRAMEPQDLVTIVDALASSLDGNGERFDRILQDLGIIGDLAADTADEARRFVNDSARLGSVLGPRGDELVNTARNLNQLLPDLAEREDNFSTLLDQTTRLAQEASALLADNAEAIDDLLETLVTIAFPALQAASSNLDGLPDFIRALARFFSFLGDVIHVTGANGEVIGGIESFMPDNPCELFAGCPQVIEDLL
jgi:phospholipid/cholesterol/gamma-HCH transport system substrate-binding protein